MTGFNHFYKVIGYFSLKSMVEPQSTPKSEKTPFYWHTVVGFFDENGHLWVIYRGFFSPLKSRTYSAYFLGNYTLKNSLRNRH
jgi:hypothetical protein